MTAERHSQIRIKDLFTYFLRRWKSILAVTVLCALALGGWQYFSVKKVHDAGEKTKEEARYEDELATYRTNLKNAEADIDACIAVWKNRTTYRDNSLYLNLDPENVWAAEKKYVISDVSGSAADILAAYTGAQRFGTLVWSGDIQSTFESLTEQIKSGLNMAMCGLPWWNTDIGGFYGGDIHSEAFRELIVRWFQYGVFCPVMRLHGSRDGHDRSRNIKEPTGGDNEIWSFGEQNLPILKDLIALRYRLIPYISRHMKKASEHGVPVMRPMFFDFPEDPVCWTTGDQYLFGDDILFAPISVRGQTERNVYLPKGSWVLTKDRTVHEGGRWVRVRAEISEFIAFVKAGAQVLDAFR